MNKITSTIFRIIFVLTITTQWSFAAKRSPSDICGEKRTFLVEDRSTQMCWLDNLGAWTSSFCIENGRKSCEAIILSTAAKQKNVNLQPDDLKGGKNPGSVICNKLGGTVMIATLANGSQMTFCKASDASLIDCNALADQFYSK